MKSATGPTGSEEAQPATHDTGSLGASDLLERVLSRPNLQAALKRVRQNKGSPGIDGMSVEELPDYLREHWVELREQLLAGNYQPRAVRRHLIPKSGGGVRELGIPTVLDRFIQQALLQVLQPLIDPSFSQHSYGFRPGRRAHGAILGAQGHIRSGITRRSGGRSVEQVAQDLRRYLVGWREYFRLADTPKVFGELDQWLRHRLRALHLKHWRRGPVIYRELRARGLTQHQAAQVAGNACRWWHNSAQGINRAFPIRYFDQLGIPRLAA